MNPDIKIRYRLKNKSGDLKTVTFTIQEIESGILLRYFGNYWEVIGRDRYTGMTDKNRVGIFENDIVKNTAARERDDEYGEHPYEVTGVVKYTGYSFEIYKQSEEDKDYHEFSAQAYMEVVGAVHENQNLL